MRSRVLPFLALAALCLAPLEARDALSKIDRDIALLMLKQIRSDLQKHYYDPTFRGLDIAATFAEAEAKIRASSSANEVSTILSNSLEQLKDSHTFFVPPLRSVRADYGWRMEMIGEAAYIVDVQKGSDADAKGLRRGDRVVALNRDVPSRENLRWLRSYYRAIRPQAQQRLIVLKPDGERRVYDIASKVTEVTVVTMELGDILDQIDRANEESERPDAMAAVGQEIVVWRMKGFGAGGKVQQAIRKARNFKTLILDMRGNAGGRVTTLNQLVSQTFDRPVTICTDKGRKKVVTDTSKPKDPFTGQIIALVDSESASASEVYARLLQIEKRGTVLGDRTAGAVMTSQGFPHEVGMGQVARFFTSITVADVLMSDGSSLEKVGVQPDELLLPTAADLAAERDPVLARAVTLAGGALTPETAGKLLPR